MENTNQISFVNGSFIAKKLSEFKGFEAKDNELLVRKIEKGTGKDSLGCVVEKVSVESFVAMLENGAVFEAAHGWINSVVNDLLKEKLEEGKMITKADYSLEAIAEFLQAEEVKQGRVSKEKIAAWFDSQVASRLHSAFVAKLGQIENEKMLEILKVYKVNFCNLAKRELSLPEQVRTNLSKALELVEAGAMKDYCASKIASAVEKTADMFAL